MRRALAAVGLVIAGLVFLRAGLDACGDKSLMVGGAKLLRATAKQNPASVLIYGPPGSRIGAAAQKLKLQKTLLRYGHSYLEAPTTSELETALKRGEFNVVMTDLADVTAVQQLVHSLQSRATVVVVAYKLTKAEADAARKERFLVKVPSQEVEYLNTIHDAVRSKT